MYTIVDDLKSRLFRQFYTDASLSSWHVSRIQWTHTHNKEPTTYEASDIMAVPAFWDVHM